MEQIDNINGIKGGDVKMPAERILKIKKEMGAADDTKTSLAKKLGISRFSIALKLDGKRPFTLEEIEKLAEIYNKNRDYFF